MVYLDEENCQVKTKSGTQCSRKARFSYEDKDNTVLCCTMHSKNKKAEPLQERPPAEEPEEIVTNEQPDEKSDEQPDEQPDESTEEIVADEQPDEQPDESTEEIVADEDNKKDDNIKDEPVNALTDEVKDRMKEEIKKQASLNVKNKKKGDIIESLVPKLGYVSVFLSGEGFGLQAAEFIPKTESSSEYERRIGQTQLLKNLQKKYKCGVNLCFIGENKYYKQLKGLIQS